MDRDVTRLGHFRSLMRNAVEIGPTKKTGHGDVGGDRMARQSFSDAFARVLLTFP